MQQYPMAISLLVRRRVKGEATPLLKVAKLFDQFLKNLTKEMNDFDVISVSHSSSKEEASILIVIRSGNPAMQNIIERVTAGLE